MFVKHTGCLQPSNSLLCYFVKVGIHLTGPHLTTKYKMKKGQSGQKTGSLSKYLVDY